jgi:hypothetical protein
VSALVVTSVFYAVTLCLTHFFLDRQLTRLMDMPHIRRRSQANSAVPDGHPSFTRVIFLGKNKALLDIAYQTMCGMPFIPSLARCDIFISCIADIKFSAVFVFLK